MKNILKYSGIILFLILLFLGIKYLYEPKIYSNLELNKLIDFKKLKTIEFITEKETTTIEKIEKDWYVTKPFNWKAANNEIESLLSNLEKSKLYGPLTENEQNYSKFEIKENSPKINLHSSKNLSLIIGKEASFNSFYVKPQDKKGVYEINGISIYDIKRNYNDLVDKNIFTADEKEIEKITIKFENKEITLNKKENAWDSEKSKNIYEKLKSIRFNTIEKTASKIKPEIIISVTTKSKVLVYEIFKEKTTYHIITDSLLLKLDEIESKKISEIKEILKK